MPHDNYKALYIHIPFCVKRCAYCDFQTQAIASDNPDLDAYIERLILEIRRRAKADDFIEIDSIYIGGGTPTHLGAARLDSLVYALSTSIVMTKPGFECTIEANPESLDVRLIRDLWALNVTRLSIGVQSFDDDVLRILGRPHTAERALEAIEIAKDRFDNVSVDLMCGIPGQSDESFRQSVATAIEAGVEHVSIYPLQIEPNTVFYKEIQAGRMPEPDSDIAAHHMEIAEELLNEAGYNRYEVASYAKPGFESKHNMAYWTGLPYIGVGSGAATMTQNSERRMRVLDEHVTDDLTRPEMEAEDLMLGMRMTKGVSHEKLEQARRYLPDLDKTLEGLIADGLAIDDGERFRPTEKGWLCGNELYERMYSLA